MGSFVYDGEKTALHCVCVCYIQKIGHQPWKFTILLAVSSKEENIILKIPTYPFAADILGGGILELLSVISFVW